MADDFVVDFGENETTSSAVVSALGSATQ